MEVRLHIGLEGLFDHHLRDSICHGRDPERPHATLRLGYLYHQHGRREVAARGQPIPELVQIV
jgi:hypothetical protein